MGGLRKLFGMEPKKHDCRRCRQSGGQLYRGYCAMCIGSHTREEWEAIRTKAGGCCYYCGRKRSLTKDHKIPISRGGRNEKHNLVAACEECNQRKGDALIGELPLNWWK